MTILSIKHPLVIIIIIFFLTRLLNLTLLPVFSDEALYIDWGWQTIHIAGKLWHPLTDAKQPFLIWLFGIGSSVFPDPLFGARLVSVFTGLLSLLVLWKICRDFFSRKTAIFCTIAYCLTPVFVFFDRQALMESAVTASGIWSLYFLLKLLDSQKIKYALLLGFSLGLGFFVKNTGLIFLVTSVSITILEIIKNKNHLNFLILSLISIIFVFLFVNLPLFFQPLYWQTLSTNSRWTFTFTELIKLPVSQWLENLAGNTQIAFLFLTPPVFIFSLFAIRNSLRTTNSVLKTILLWILISFFIYLISLKFMNFMSFRYLTPFLPPILIIVSKYYPKYPLLLLSLFVTLSLILNSVKFFRFDSAINRYSYIDGYVTGMDTGYQVNEIVKYFRVLSQNQKIIVTTAVHTFNPESGVWIYLKKNPNITMAYLDGRMFGSQLDHIDCLGVSENTYFVAKLSNTENLQRFLDKVTVITNPYNSDYSTIYKIKSDCTGSFARLDLTE